jgi:membrane associated rhomboid family serine protease
MIPLRDSNPTRTFPFVNYLLIGINVFVFLIEISMGKGMEKLIFYFGLIPSEFLSNIRSLDFGAGVFIPLISSMFLHGGWMHLIGNMLFLHIFGDNVEDRFGHLKYFIFYLLAGFAAAS